jgi:hypothetical protein
MAKQQTPFGLQDGDKVNIAVQRPTINEKVGQNAQVKDENEARSIGASDLHGLFS